MERHESRPVFALKGYSVAQREEKAEPQARLIEQVEETQVHLRHSIAANRAFVEQTQRLLDSHRRGRESPGS